MKVLFRNKEAEKQYSPKYSKKWKYPKDVKEKLLAAGGVIKAATSLKDIMNYRPFHFHRLLGKRHGEWGIDLGRKTGFRIIVIPCNDDNSPILEGDILAQCKAIKVLEIMEVTNHYE